MSPTPHTQPATHDELHRPPLWLGIAFLLIVIAGVTAFAWLIIHLAAIREQAASRHTTLTLPIEHCPRPIPGQVLVITASPSTAFGADFSIHCQIASARKL